MTTIKAFVVPKGGYDVLDGETPKATCHWILSMTAIDSRRPWWGWPLLLASAPFVALVLALWFASAVVLQILVWTTWCVRGRYALVVYSNSPIWQEYFEQQVLPAVGGRGVVLNWSDRKQWPYSLPVALFRIFGGTREFNPLAVVFRPFAWPRSFRFYRPFQAFKHGRRQEVEEMRRQLLEMLDGRAPAAERK